MRKAKAEWVSPCVDFSSCKPPQQAHCFLVLWSTVSSPRTLKARIKCTTLKKRPAVLLALLKTDEGCLARMACL